MRNRRLRFAIFPLILFALLIALPPAVAADEGWVIKSFDVSYHVNTDGTFDVVEDIRVDFGSLEKHGIFREIPYKYDYRDADGVAYKRVTKIDVSSVDDGSQRIQYETSRNGSYLTLKIGDPDRTISGEQRYVISYRVSGGMNPQPDSNELYWNVTGNGWPVAIERATATVVGPGALKATCFTGVFGSSSPCQFAQQADGSFDFDAGRRLPSGHGLTLVVAFDKSAVNAPPLVLEKVKSEAEKVRDFIGLKPLPIAAALLLGVLGTVGVSRYWWETGRDRWRGDVQYLTSATETAEEAKPLFAKETVVVEYQPPETGKRRTRRLRPAEIGVLVDERADTLDVSATIVDLAVRGYLRITEVEKKWFFGSRDYSLERLKPSDEELIPYERRLLDSLFEDGETVQMSDLKNKFYTDLKMVKQMLYTDVTSELKLFSGNPENARTMHAAAGLIIAVIGGVGIFVLGGLGAAIIAVPVILAGLLLLALSGSMARRTSSGRELYRRALGFREYMLIAETDRQQFHEEANLFHEYLPYAIVFGCTGKWARAFESLEGQPPDTSSWYVSPRPFLAADFAREVNSFSGTLSSTMASTPGGSGGSGFSSGGGFSGGGGGGGGGGSW